MTVQLEDIAVGAGEHVVRFYEDDRELARLVGRYLRAVGAGSVAIVVATEAHRRAIVAELQAAGIDTTECARGGTLVLLDARATLARFMPQGRLDGDATYHSESVSGPEHAESLRQVCRLHSSVLDAPIPGDLGAPNGRSGSAVGIRGRFLANRDAPGELAT
jgi:hypothetical protein